MKNEPKIITIYYHEPCEFETIYKTRIENGKEVGILKEFVTDTKIVATQIFHLSDNFNGDIKKLVQHVAKDNSKFNPSYTYKVI